MRKFVEEQPAVQPCRYRVPNLMIALALLPLGLYCFVLTLLAARSRPTVLTGTQDFMLLACGLSGLLTFGPGRLLIPVNLLTFWGVSIWIFWLGFYLVFFFLVAEKILPIKTVVYHCSLPGLVPFLIEWGRTLDPKFRFEGNVMHLPGFGVQCSVTGDALGGHVLFTATGPRQNKNGWDHFNRHLREFCRNRPATIGLSAWLWGLLSVAFLSASVVVLILNGSTLLERFNDYWL